MGELNKSSDFSELDVIGELVEFDDVMKRCQGIAGLTRAVGWAGGQGVLRGAGLQGTSEFRGWAYRVQGMPTYPYQPESYSSRLSVCKNLKLYNCLG